MRSVTSDVDFPANEREILESWQSKQTFEKSNQQRAQSKEFAFYDGPPFANGLPHYGHLLANTIKDTVPRYWVMRGFKVDRRCGWDCHGVPVEYEIEKREQLKGRQDILKLGVQKFNDFCRESAFHYAGEWQKTLTRLGRWVDWSDQYRTLDLSFMESVWWVFGELYRKNLVYRDYKVVPYSPRITAVLSNFEANQNYKTVQDPALTVKFKLVDEDAFILAWTTTPWTLISNLALAVGPKITYVKIKDLETNETYYLAKDRLGAVYRKGGEGKAFTTLSEMSADQLAGRKYVPLFPYFAKQPKAFVIIADDYVTTSDGTGVVHNAPAYGEDDFRVCKSKGIELVDPLDEDARFKDEVPEYKGQFVKDADKNIIKFLKDTGVLLRHDTIEHSYPFCERTDTPLIYRAIPAWYVAVEGLRDRLTANNKTITWVPGHLRDGRMGKWLENARDWAISRNRFWGTPLPIWVCDKNQDHLEIFSSVKDLEARTNTKISDLHKPGIDEFFFGCKACNGKMGRVPEVFDCWFESGSMPYAQLHYPFENKKRFEEIFPADFIAEGLDQTRGWFYTLSVLSTALFDKPAFKNVIVNGVILDETGRKMSKRHRNYTAPDALLEKYGSDSVRLYMLNSSILRGEDLIFSDVGVKDTTRAVLLPLWNSHSFLTTYAAADGWQPDASLAAGKAPRVEAEMDRWLVSRLQSLLQDVHKEMELYRLFAVVPLVLSFIDDLTNWYIRRSRRRFWGVSTQDEEESTGPASAGRSGPIPKDTEDAYKTLYYVLCTFSKAFAPFAPFVSDRMYRNLTDGVAGCPESVHLCDMPLADETLIDRNLESRMKLLRQVSNLGRSLRAKHKIKTRQALPEILVITRNTDDKSAIEAGANIIREELNVKEIAFSTDETKFVNLKLRANLKTLGPRLGKDLGKMRQELEALSTDPSRTASLVGELDEKGWVEVLGHRLEVQDFLIERGPKDDRLVATEGGVTVLLDTRLSEELILEGLSREFINRIQRLRKESGLQVTDRIKVKVAASDSIQKAIEANRSYVMSETLMTQLEFVTDITGALGAKIEMDGAELQVQLIRA